MQLHIAQRNVHMDERHTGTDTQTKTHTHIVTLQVDPELREPESFPENNGTPILCPRVQLFLLLKISRRWTMSPEIWCFTQALALHASGLRGPIPDSPHDYRTLPEVIPMHRAMSKCEHHQAWSKIYHPQLHQNINNNNNKSTTNNNKTRNQINIYCSKQHFFFKKWVVQHEDQ